MGTIKILSIDDDPAIRYALEAVFDFEGWTSLMAADVDQGIQMFRQYHPDIVLIDYHLPRINGIEGVRMLRQLSQTVPIIVFTIDEDQAVADRFLEAGASDFALKPIKAPDMISRIRLHIRLMEVEKQREGEKEERVTKGIRPGTLELIEQFLKQAEDYVIVETIAAETGLAYQTTYRYLQYLVTEGVVEVKSTYGKVGRPKQGFRLK